MNNHLISSYDVKFRGKIISADPLIWPQTECLKKIYIQDDSVQEPVEVKFWGSHAFKVNKILAEENQYFIELQNVKIGEYKD